MNQVSDLNLCVVISLKAAAKELLPQWQQWLLDQHQRRGLLEQQQQQREQDLQERLRYLQQREQQLQH